MYREFISPAEEKKLDIFKSVCNTNGISLLKLSRVLKIPIKSLQKHIYFLNEDFKYLSVNLCLAKNSYNQYCIERNGDSAEPSYSQLVYHYLLSSPQYQLVQYLIGHTDSSMSQLCSDLHVSQSHMYRLIKKVSLILKKFHLSIYSNEENIVELAGRELDIRIFIYSFLTQSAPTEFQLLSDQYITEFEQFNSFFYATLLDQLTKNKLFAFWKTITIRLSQKKYLPEIEKKAQALLNFYSFLPMEVLDSFFFSKTNLDKRIAQAEYLYLNFFLHIFLPAVVDRQKIQESIALVYQSKKPLVHFFIDMIEDWRQKFVPTMKQDSFDQLLNSCLLFFNLSIFIDVDLLKVWNLDYNLPDESSIDNNSQTYTAIAHLLTEHVNTFPNNDLDKEFFHRKQLRYLAQLLYLETTMHESPTIRIYIRTTIQYRTKMLIEARIRSIYSEKSVSFTKDIEGADLIITDNYEEVAITEKLLLLSDILNMYEWESLFAKINQVITKKMFALTCKSSC